MTNETEQAWRKAIADQVRRNCTPGSEAYAAGGDKLIYAVCDWIENPPEWSAFEVPGSKGAALIAAERARQHAEEGYDAEHDRGHAGQLALAAQAYCYAGADDLGASPFEANDPDDPPFDWPWHSSYWKPTGDPVRDLVKSGALIAAAIDSILAEQAEAIVPAMTEDAR